MKLRFEDLSNQLPQGLLPVYIVSGDEPLQHGEACDDIRAQARQQGFNERQVMHAEKSFDWEEFLTECNSMSLFAEQRLLELRLPTGKPGDKGAKALLQFAAAPPEDTVLLVICGKLDAATQRSKWFTALQDIGASVQVWPVEVKMLPNWIKRRMQQHGLKPSADAVELLAERVEGNLLAAAQEIEKLKLLHGDASIDFDMMAAAVADSARYDIYGLVDAALGANVRRFTRMLAGLRAEGSESVLILWALTREIRSLQAMAIQMEQGQSLEQVVAKARVWPKRKALVAGALRRHKSGVWMVLLQRAAGLDRIIKGQSSGNIWDELLQLCLAIAGIRLFRSNHSATAANA